MSLGTIGSSWVVREPGSFSILCSGSKIAQKPFFIFQRCHTLCVSKTPEVWSVICCIFFDLMCFAHRTSVTLHKVRRSARHVLGVWVHTNTSFVDIFCWIGINCPISKSSYLLFLRKILISPVYLPVDWSIFSGREDGPFWENGSWPKTAGGWMDQDSSPILSWYGSSNQK